MSESANPSAELRRLVFGFRTTQALHVAATLGIADLLAAGPRSSADLATATDCHPDALYRLLRALASVGVLHEGEDGAFSLTPLGDGLRRDSPESLHGAAAYVGRPYYWAPWSSLLHSVRTGENAFRHVHGTDVWEYRAAHPEEGAIFDGAMESMTRLADRSLLDAYDFGRFGNVVDVGGGNGTLLALLLGRHPDLQGVLFDQPHVVAPASDVLGPAGVADRCRVVGGSFFEEVPEGGDAYVLKSIVHDWEDEEAVAILRVCRRAMTDGAVVLLVERELGPANDVPEPKFSDLNMLVSPGGRERTIEQYAALFERADLRLVRVVPSAAGLNVIEAEPAADR